MDTQGELKEEEIQSEQNIPSASSVENEITLGKSLLGSQNFDEERFRQDAERARQEGRDIRSLNKKDYLKRKDPPNITGGGFTSPHLSFSSKFEDGFYTAVGSNGQTIKSPNFEEFTTTLALSFKNEDGDTQNPPLVKFQDNKNSRYTPEQIELQTKIFINNGVGIHGDVPKDPKFWQQFKTEYLNNKNNTPEMWDKLTSKVNPEYMSSQANNNLGRFLHNMRMGTNTNLTPRRQTNPRHNSLAPQSLNHLQYGGRT